MSKRRSDRDAFTREESVAPVCPDVARGTRRPAGLERRWLLPPGDVPPRSGRFTCRGPRSPRAMPARFPSASTRAKPSRRVRRSPRKRRSATTTARPRPNPSSRSPTPSTTQSRLMRRSTCVTTGVPSRSSIQRHSQPAGRRPTATRSPSPAMTGPTRSQPRCPTVRSRPRPRPRSSPARRRS